MATSPVLLALLNCKAEINYLTAQQLYWTNMYDANHTRFANQEKYKKTYDDAYDKALDTTSDISATNKLTGETIEIKANEGNEDNAKLYAQAKSPYYDPDDYEDLEDLDMNYDTMKTLIETELEVKNSEYDALKEKVSSEAQNTNLLGS